MMHALFRTMKSLMITSSLFLSLIALPFLFEYLRPYIHLLNYE